MLHLFKYRIISILKEKQVVFWSMLFPILLATMFYLSFGSSDNEIETINVALVKEDNSDMSQNFIKYLDMLESDNSELISVKKLSKKEANKKLEKLEITGIYYAGEEPELVVTSNDTSSSVLKSLLDTYNGQAQIYKDVILERPEKLATIAKSDYLEFTNETTLGGKSVDGEIQYFLALIGMACMFGCFIGHQVSIQLQANVTSVGLRRAVSSISKFKQIVSDTLAGVFIHYINLAILLFYLIFLLHLDLSGNIVKLVGICIAGGFIGVSLGIFVGTLSKIKEGVRIGILVSIGLLASFCTGLMFSNIKGIIENVCPIFNRINPAAVITDAIYSTSIYDDPERYASDIIILVVMSAIIGIVTFIKTRRECYDNI